MTIRERVIRFLDYKGMTKYRFYKETGISNGFLDKKGAIGSDKLKLMCDRYPDLNPLWLLLEKGEMTQKVKKSKIKLD